MVLLVATPTAIPPPTAMTVGGTTNKETFENTFMTAEVSLVSLAIEDVHL